MKLTILGSSGGYPEPGRACSGYLIETGGASIWVDAGTGTLDALLRLHALEQLDAIVVTHLHPDHWTDLPIALHRVAVTSAGRVERPIPVFGPDGWPEATGIAGQWFASADSPPFVVRTLDASVATEIGDLTMTAASVEHGMPTFALRFSDGRRTLAFSADTAPCDGLLSIARQADLFLCEATLPDGKETPISMNPAQAARIAHEAGAGWLVLTHLLPGIDPGESCAVARRHFSGPVDHTDPGREFAI
jgi:ribonuclease BN (tRNA processing enzyme)